MAVFLVTWDLNREKPNYAQARAKLIGRLDQYESTRDPRLDSVRFVSANWTVQQVSDDLTQYIDSNDRLVVVQMTQGNHQGWLSKETWAWVNSHL